jgi:hypothetical protein
MLAFWLHNYLKLVLAPPATSLDQDNASTLRPHTLPPSSTGTRPQPYACTNCHHSLDRDPGSTMCSHEPPPPPSIGTRFNHATTSQGVEAKVSQDMVAGDAGRRWPPTPTDWIGRGWGAWAVTPWHRPWHALCRHALMAAPPPLLTFSSMWVKNQCY